MRKQILSKAGRTARNLRLGGYGAFAHQRDQNLFTHTLSFTALNDGKGQGAPTFLYKRGRRAKICLAIMKFKSLLTCYKFIAWLICLTKFMGGMISSCISVGKSYASGSPKSIEWLGPLPRDG